MSRKKMGCLIALCIVGVFVALIIAQAIYIYKDSMWGDPASIVCFKEAHFIGMAMIQYAHDHGDNYPVSFGVLLKEGYVGAHCFICPLRRRKLPAGFPEDPRNGDLAVLNSVDEWGAWVMAPGVRRDMDIDFIILYEKPPAHRKGEMFLWSLVFGSGEQQRPCMFNDGHVEFVPEDRFQ